MKKNPTVYLQNRQASATFMRPTDQPLNRRERRAKAAHERWAAKQINKKESNGQTDLP